MPYFRLYRIGRDGRILDAITIEAQDETAAVSAAIAYDHAPWVEIWSGHRLVARVDPEAKTAIII